MRGDFDHVHVTLFPPGYEIHQLKIDERVDKGWKHPLFYAERVKTGLDMGGLLHGRIAAHARIDEPKIIFTVREKAEKKPAVGSAGPGADAAQGAAGAGRSRRHPRR